MNGSLIARYTYDTWGNTLSIVDVSKKILDKLVNGTRSAGVNVNADFGVQYTLSVGIAYDGKGNIGYAFSSGPGGGPPIPAELHGDITNTKIISVNIFELYDNIYNSIMEW